jgi:secondary thiamine-phosphate synthase enzyme
MKSYRKELWLNATGRREFINITPQVEQCVAESGISEGMVLVNAMHNTAAVFINDDEDGLLKDLDDWLESLAPRKPTSDYRHNKTGEDNAEAHLKRLVIGREAVVAITEGLLDLGAFEQLFFADFDGGRPKRVLVKIIGE